MSRTKQRRFLNNYMNAGLPEGDGEPGWGPDKAPREGRRKGKQSMHDRKARALEKRGGFDMPEEVDEEPDDSRAPLDPREDGLPPLTTLQIARVEAARDRLSKLRAAKDGMGDIDAALGRDFAAEFDDELDEAVSFADGFLRSGTIDNPIYLDNLDRQVRGLAEDLKRARDGIAEAKELARAEREERDRHESEERARLEAEELARIESEEEARVRQEEEDRRLADEEAQHLQETAEAAARSSDEGLTVYKKKDAEMDDIMAKYGGTGGSKKNTKKKRNKQPKKQVLQLDNPLQLFKAHFNPNDFSGAVHLKDEVLGVDKHFMDKDGTGGYFTRFFRLTPYAGTPLEHVELVVHAHMNGAGGLRTDPKVIPKGYEALSNGTMTGSSECRHLTGGHPARLGIP